MAMIKCADCGRDISDGAPHCIYCGRPGPAFAAGNPADLRPGLEPPRRVITSEDSFLTRGRGCADLLLFGFILVVTGILALALFGGC